MFKDLKYRVLGLGLKIEALGFMVKGKGSRVEGVGSDEEGSRKKKLLGCYIAREVLQYAFHSASHRTQHVQGYLTFKQTQPPRTLT